MKCKNCFYKEIRTVTEFHAFDVPDKRKYFTEDIDYCNEYEMECEDAYLNCLYRDIIVEAQHIEHAINLLRDNYFDNKFNAIEQLKKILRGEE